jgi:hypothetical protein
MVPAMAAAAIPGAARVALAELVEQAAAMELVMELVLAAAILAAAVATGLVLAVAPGMG